MAANALLMVQTNLFTGPVAQVEVTDRGSFLRARHAPGLRLALDEKIAKNRYWKTNRTVVRRRKGTR